MNDKERIAELADAFNRVCDENADFVVESIKTDRRIAELEGDVKDLHADIARLTTEAYTREAEIKTLRVGAERYLCLRDNFDFSITQNKGYDWVNLVFADEIDAAIDAARKGK